MKKIGLGLALISILSMASCNQAITDYHTCLEKYVASAEKTPSYYDGFKIVQLTDLHWETMTIIPDAKDYLKNLIDSIIKEKGKIDLIQLTGDEFMFFNMNTVLDLINTLESFEIPYSVLWGNHDRQGRANPVWIADQFRSAKHCLFTQVDNDNVYGASNYVINLKDELDNVRWQIVNLDSGADYTDDSLGIGMTYDYIRQDQAEWWKAEHDAVGDDVPVMAYYHIAQYETEMAWADYLENGYGQVTKQKFFKLEGFGGSKANKTPYFFNMAKDHGLKGIFVGHAHSVDLTFDYQGVTIGFGVKTGKELYYGKVSKEDAASVGIDRGFDLVGASIVTLHDGGNFDLEHFYFDNAGFSEWVVY